MKKVLFIMSALTLGLVGCADDITKNPLVAEWDTPFQTPPFSKIELKHYEPAIDYAIEQNRAEIDAIISNPEAPTFENTIVAMAESGELLGRITGVFYVLNNCISTPEMQQIALNISPKLTALSNDVSLNPELFARVKAVYDQRESLELDQEDKMLLEETYKGFARSGALLEGEAQELYRQYTTELSQLTLEFGQNALKATNAFSLNITDEAKVAELPDFVKEGLAAEAAARGQEGWTVTLDAPSYGPFMTYSSQRDLKEQLYVAYNTRAKGGEFDNMENIRKIANLRLQIANLLGYETYADYVLEDRMAENRTTVVNFLNELCDATMDYAKKDVATVTEFAKSLGFEGELMPWDWGYYNEKYKEAKYSINDEQIKPYLQLENAIDAVFMLAGKLYGLTFTPAPEIETYHPEATAYEVKDENGELMAILYLDFFPRESKRQGAWMTEFRGVKVKDGVEQRPLVQLVMNFTKPTATTPSLLTFDEFTTFLHEFGHGLHGILAKGKYESINGTNVKRDFVELPSQIMENWAFQPEIMKKYAVHHRTGEVIPDHLIAKIQNASLFNQGFVTTELAAAALIDMDIHSLETFTDMDINAFEKYNLATRRGLIPEIEPRYRYTYFAHIFNGGYSSGYYFYTWAEVLDKDAAEAVDVASADLLFNPVADDETAE